MGFRLIPISASQIVGPLGPGVTLPADQVSGGAFAGDVVMPIGQVTSGVTGYVYRAGSETGSRVTLDGSLAEVRIHDAAGVKRLQFNGDDEGDIFFYSKNTAETAPAHITCYSINLFGRLEIQGPSLNSVDGAHVVVDSQDVEVSSATHIGTASLLAPAGDAIVEGSSSVQINSGGDITLSPAAGKLVHIAGDFVIDPGFQIFAGTSNFYNTVGMHSNAQIVLDDGSWIKRGNLAGASLQNGWYNWGSGFQNGSYTEFPDRTAGLFGVIGAGSTTGGTVLFNIPSAIRPAQNHVFLCAGDGSRKCQVVVQSDGNVKLQSPDAGLSWISLGCCRWPMNGF